MLRLLADENLHGAIVRGHAWERVRTGLSMPGVVEIATEVPLGQAITDVLLLAQASEDGEWEGQILYLPL